MSYKPRLYDSLVDSAFAELPALAIEGAKGVGKTSTAEQHTKLTLRFDVDETIDLISNGIQVLRSQEKPVCLDEWQRFPKVWDYVRRLVDEDSSPTQFLLTGSAAPRDVKLHSGAGRIAKLRMRPLSLQEREIEYTTVSLSDLLKNKTQEVSGTTDISLVEYVHEIIVSGFPGIRHLSEKNARLQLDGYLDYLVQKEFPEQGLVVRKPDVLKRWLRAYAAATGSTAGYQAILDASTPGEKKPAKSTTLTYRDVLDSLWMTDRVDAWLPTVNPFTALGKSPKHYLADPALSARLLRMTETQLLQGAKLEMLGPQHGSVVGRLFEALIALSLQTYVTVNQAELRHFRSAKGDREVDFIIERDYNLVAVEVKMAINVDDSDVQNIKWLKRKCPDYDIQGVVVNTGSYAYTRKDGIHVVPAALLSA